MDRQPRWPAISVRAWLPSAIGRRFGPWPPGMREILPTSHSPGSLLDDRKKLWPRTRRRPSTLSSTTTGVSTVRALRATCRYKSLRVSSNEVAVLTRAALGPPTLPPLFRGVMALPDCEVGRPRSPADNGKQARTVEVGRRHESKSGDLKRCLIQSQAPYRLATPQRATRFQAHGPRCRPQIGDRSPSDSGAVRRTTPEESGAPAHPPRESSELRVPPYPSLRECHGQAAVAGGVW
jgi:hypothetical protein